MSLQGENRCISSIHSEAGLKSPTGLRGSSGISSLPGQDDIDLLYLINGSSPETTRKKEAANKSFHLFSQVLSKFLLSCSILKKQVIILWDCQSPNESQWGTCTFLFFEGTLGLERERRERYKLCLMLPFLLEDELPKGLYPTGLEGHEETFRSNSPT